MPIIYIKGIEPPCKPSSCCTLGFIRGKGDTALNNTCLWLSLWIHQLSNPNSNYLNFAFVRSCRDSKEKNCRDWSRLAMSNQRSFKIGSFRFAAFVTKKIEYNGFWNKILDRKKKHFQSVLSNFGPKALVLVCFKICLRKQKVLFCL